MSKRATKQETELRVANACGKKTKSCGCLIKEHNINQKDPRKGTKEWNIYYSANRRARENGIPFDIYIEDIVIPENVQFLVSNLS